MKKQQEKSVNQIEVSKSDIFSGYIAQILTMASGAFLLPFILSYMSESELAMWYIFQSFMFIGSVLDFGFQPVFIRNISYLISGAKDILKEGVIKEHTEEPNYPLLKILRRDMVIFYTALSILLGLILFLLGKVYLVNIISTDIDQSYYMLCWNIFSLTLCMNTFFSYQLCLLQGKGLIKDYNIIVIASKASLVLVCILMLILGYGLLSMIISYAFSSLLQRILFMYYNKKRSILPNILTNSDTNRKTLLDTLWYSASRQGVDSISFFLKTQGFILLLPFFFDDKTVASYGITTQLIGLLTTISIIYFRTHIPFFSQLIVQKRIAQLRFLFSKSMFIYVGIFIIASISLVALGPTFLRIIKSRTALLDVDIILVILVSEFLYYYIWLVTNLLSLCNFVSYHKSNLIISVMFLLLSSVLLKYTSIGLLGLFVIQFLIQLSYPFWKWPKELSLRLGIDTYKSILLGLCFFLKKYKPILQK